MGRDVANDALRHVVTQRNDAGVHVEAVAGHHGLLVREDEAHDSHPEHVGGHGLRITDLTIQYLHTLNFWFKERVFFLSI